MDATERHMIRTCRTTDGCDDCPYGSGAPGNPTRCELFVIIHGCLPIEYIPED